jgi:hypothetical protein
MRRLLFGDRYIDDTLVITNFYKVFPPDVRAIKHRAVKVKALIEQMGSKYLLSETRGKLNGINS